MDKGLPLFSFGVIADVQYADHDDGWNFAKTYARHYRNSLIILKEAVKMWKATPNIAFIAQLGDLIDGLNSKMGHSTKSLELLLKQLEDFKVYHLVGNHELYNFPRNELHSFLNTQPVNGKAYYDFSPCSGWRVLVLDTFEFCTIQSETRAEALKFLKLYNPNDVSNYQSDWTKDLTGLNRRFLPYNGAVSKIQLEWLTQALTKSTEIKEKVIILTHVPLNPDSCSPSTLLWNYDEVLTVLHSFKCVVACLAGHDHQGGYTRDAHGIHYRTFEAPLETPLGENAFGVIHVYEDKLILKGSGIILDDTWVF